MRLLAAGILIATAGTSHAEREPSHPIPEDTSATSTAVPSNTQTDTIRITRANLRRIIEYVQQQEQLRKSSAQQEADLQRAQIGRAHV